MSHTLNVDLRFCAFVVSLLRPLRTGYAMAAATRNFACTAMRVSFQADI